MPRLQTGGPAISNRPLILLAAHTERGGAANDQRLTNLVGAIAARCPEADMASVAVNIEGDVELALAGGRAAGQRVLVLPLLFSDGFFFRKRIVPFIDGVTAVSASPLCDWDGFAAMLAEGVSGGRAGAKPLVVLVAHGSKSSEASKDAANRVASRLSGYFARVETAFLEEPPFADDVIAGLDEPFVLAGLFLGAGLHGREDFDRLVAAAGTRAISAFTVGEMPGLADLVAAEVQSRLAGIMPS